MLSLGGGFLVFAVLLDFGGRYIAWLSWVGGAAVRPGPCLWCKPRLDYFTFFRIV